MDRLTTIFVISSVYLTGGTSLGGEKVFFVISKSAHIASNFLYNKINPIGFILLAKVALLPLQQSRRREQHMITFFALWMILMLQIP